MKRAILSFITGFVLSVCALVAYSSSIGSYDKFETGSIEETYKSVDGGDFNCGSGAQLKIPDSVCSTAPFSARIEGDLPDSCQIKWTWNNKIFKHESGEGEITGKKKIMLEPETDEDRYVSSRFATINAIPVGDDCDCESASKQPDIVPTEFNVKISSSSGNLNSIKHGSKGSWEAESIQDETGKEIPLKYVDLQWFIRQSNNIEKKVGSGKKFTETVRIQQVGEPVSKEICSGNKQFGIYIILSASVSSCANEEAFQHRVLIDPGEFVEKKSTLINRVVHSEEKWVSDDPEVINGKGQPLSPGEPFIFQETKKIKNKAVAEGSFGASINGNVSLAPNNSFGWKVERKRKERKSAEKTFTRSFSVERSCSEDAENGCLAQILKPKVIKTKVLAVSQHKVFDTGVNYLCDGKKRITVISRFHNYILHIEEKEEGE